MRIRIVVIGMLLLLCAAVMAAMQNGNDLYQQGLARETAGDIKGAIQIFERIVRDFSSNRTLTAKSLVQLGRWSDLLGQNEARKYYERVIREFADQKEASAEARARLDVLAKVSAPGASPARRLVVDWHEWNRKMGNTSRNLTRDGRHVLRYNEEQRAFEEIELSTGNARRLTSEGPNPADELLTGNGELSTDGRRVAAAFGILKKPRSAAAQTPEFERIELRLFEVGGRGIGRVLTSWAAQPGTPPEIYLVAWSPRNDRIWLAVVPSDQSEQIVSVDMTGKVQVLKTLPWAGSTQQPSLSPDGRFLVYHDSTGRQTPPDIYITAADGTREHRIEHPADDSKPVFMPDGSGIVFESNRRGFRDLWYQAIVDGQPTGQPRLVWHNLGFFGAVHRFTDTGGLYYYFATNDWGTYTVPLDLNAGSIGEPTRLTPPVNDANSGPAFSPDGRYLAHFRSNASRVVIRELATGREREIPLGAPLQASYASTHWCPSGNSLIASGYVNGTGPVSYRVNVKEASVQRLPISATASSPVCIGDGEEIIYVPAPPIQAAPGSMIVRRSMISGRETTLFTGTVGSLALSMDGRRLAIVTIDPSKNLARLFTMPAAGGEVSADVMTSGTVLTAGQTYALMDVTWMPGDRLLVFRMDNGPFTTGTAPPIWFWEAPLTGAAPRKLGPLPPVGWLGSAVSNFTVHPDGKQLAYQLREGNVAQTWAIDNLSQFIKAGGGW